MCWEGYEDHIIVLRKIFDEHLTNLEDIFKRIQAVQLILNTKKCQRFKNKVNYLLHTVYNYGADVEDCQTAFETNDLFTHNANTRLPITRRRSYSGYSCQE